MVQIMEMVEAARLRHDREANDEQARLLLRYLFETTTETQPQLAMKASAGGLK